MHSSKRRWDATEDDRLLTLMQSGSTRSVASHASSLAEAIRLSAIDII